MQNYISSLFLSLSLFFSGTLLAQTAQTDTQVDRLLENAKKQMDVDTKKTFFYLNDALQYKDEMNKRQLLKLYKLLGIAHSKHQSYITALDYYYKCLELQKKFEPSKMLFTQNNIGYIYLSMGDTLKTEKFWKLSYDGVQKALKQDSIEKRNIKSFVVYNNLAVLEMEKGNFKTAMKMFTEYKRQSIQLKDTSAIITSYQNLYAYYEKLNKTDSARFYFNRGIYLGKKINSAADLAFLYYDAGNEFHKKKRDSASFYLHNAFDYADKAHLNEVKLSSARALADLYNYKKNYEKSNEFLIIANKLSEESINNQSKRKVEMLEFEYEQKMNEQEILVQAKRRESILIFSCILLVPLSVIVFLMYRLQRTRAKKRLAENELLIQKLEGKNKELTSNAIQMLQTSEIIDSTHKELRQLKGMADAPTNNVLNLIISDLKKGNQSFNKKEFEKVFIETDEAFYKKLLQEFPTLTNNEIRLCAFAKMNFSTKDISAITQQSANSILVARSRLRKKIGLDENQSLTTFLKGF